MSERSEHLREAVEALRANDGIGSSEEAVATVEALLSKRPVFDEKERGLLGANDGFCDMVVREAERTILHATIDELVEFAYGDWAAARAAWRHRQRGRFRALRRERRSAA